MPNVKIVFKLKVQALLRIIILHGDIKPLKPLSLRVTIDLCCFSERHIFLHYNRSIEMSHN